MEEIYRGAGSKYRPEIGPLPLAVVSILPFVGHALGGRAERASTRPIEKRCERFHRRVAPPSSIISFSTDPITSAQFLGCCTRRYYINNNPAGRIIGSNEKKERKEERKGGKGGKKRKVILSRFSLVRLSLLLDFTLANGQIRILYS